MGFTLSLADFPLSHPKPPRALTLLTTPPCRRERIRAAKIKARPHWQHPKLICQRSKTTFRLQLILKTPTHPAPGSRCAQLGGRGREAPRKRGRPGFAPSEIREQGETGQATTLDFRAARVGWHTGSNYTLLPKLVCSQVTSWQRWSISEDRCSAVYTGEWWWGCIWVVNDTFRSCSVYYIAWTSSKGRKQKQGKDPKCSSKQKIFAVTSKIYKFH